MRRAIITVKGKVQKVRYRSKVKGIADGLGIVGEVENREGFGSLGEKIAGIKEDTGEMTNTLYSLSTQINLFFF